MYSCKSSSFRRIAVSNRHLCREPLACRIAALKGRIDTLILREKDMAQQDYQALALEVKAACERADILLICHTFISAARTIDCPCIHLPLSRFAEAKAEGSLRDFRLTGASVHSLKEALLAQELGADYVIAGNIFETSCKQGLPGKGTEFLEKLCRELAIPVWGLGGITAENEEQIRQSGAAGACRMSGYMTD